MLVIGSKGFAKEVLEIAHQLNQLKNLTFYDDLSNDLPDKLYNVYPIIKTTAAAQEYFNEIDNQFTIGIGNPLTRKKLYDIFINLGGVFTSLISPLSQIGHYGNSIESGCNIMTGTIITNDIVIKKGALINLNCTIGHDSIIGRFVELSPGVHISGNCEVGDYSILGTNSTVLPKIKIGANVVVGAGSVVTKDVPDNSVIVGVPGRVIKERKPLSNQ